MVCYGYGRNLANVYGFIAFWMHWNFHGTSMQKLHSSSSSYCINEIAPFVGYTNHNTILWFTIVNSLTCKNGWSADCTIVSYRLVWSQLRFRNFSIKLLLLLECRLHIHAVLKSIYFVDTAFWSLFYLCCIFINCYVFSV